MSSKLSGRSAQALNSPRENGSNAARTISTFSSDIAHAVSRGGVLLSMQSSRPAAPWADAPLREKELRAWNPCLVTVRRARSEDATAMARVMAAVAEEGSIATEPPVDI